MQSPQRSSKPFSCAVSIRVTFAPSLPRGFRLSYRAMSDHKAEQTQPDCITERREAGDRVVIASIKKRLKEFLPDWFVSIRAHWKSHGVFPNIISPTTFNEKVLYRILFDRRTVLTQIANKAGVRSYVEQRLGPQLLPKLYYLTKCPETIPFDDLPDRFVVKPTHGSGWVRVVTNKTALDRTALIETCTGWLNQSFYKQTRQWVYKNIEPHILVEEFIDDGTGSAPNDYKLLVFGGIVEFIQVDAARFSDHRRRLYSPAWEKLDVLLHYDE